MAAIRFELAAHSMGSYGDAMCHAWRNFILKWAFVISTDSLYNALLQLLSSNEAVCSFAQALSSAAALPPACIKEESGVLCQQVSDDRPHVRQKDPRDFRQP
jgi:hypothetical protein